MTGERIEFTRIVDIIHRLWRGQSQASISRDVGVTTRTVTKYKCMAKAAGWFSPESPCPDSAEIEKEIQEIDSARIEKYSKPVLTPYKNIITKWLAMKIPLIAIRILLIEKHGVKVSYGNVQRFCYRLKNDQAEL